MLSPHSIWVYSMAWTVDQVVNEARRILQDENAITGYRYTDDHILTALNGGLGEVRRIRPDLFILSLTDDLPVYVAADITAQTPLPIHDMFTMPLVSYVAGWIELADDEFTVDNRAVSLLTRFTQQLVMGG